MKKAGNFSVPSNLTGKFSAILLASLNNSLSDYALKNEDAGHLHEKIWPYTCPTCEELLPYLFPFDTRQICTSMIMTKAGHFSVHSNL